MAFGLGPWSLDGPNSVYPWSSLSDLELAIISPSKPIHMAGWEVKIMGTTLKTLKDGCGTDVKIKYISIAVSIGSTRLLWCCSNFLPSKFPWQLWSAEKLLYCIGKDSAACLRVWFICSHRPPDIRFREASIWMLPASNGCFLREAWGNLFTVISMSRVIWPLLCFQTSED